MTPAEVRRTAEMVETLSKVRYLKKHHRAGHSGTLAIAGTTPITLPSALLAYVLAAAEASLVTELAKLGVTDLEAA